MKKYVCGYTHFSNNPAIIILRKEYFSVSGMESNLSQRKLGIAYISLKSIGCHESYSTSGSGGMSSSRRRLLPTTAFVNVLLPTTALLNAICITLMRLASFTFA